MNRTGECLYISNIKTVTSMESVWGFSTQLDFEYVLSAYPIHISLKANIGHALLFFAQGL